MHTERLMADAAGIDRAAELLRSGTLVAIPTETVYGLAANALDAAAVEKIFAAKGRPQDNPLIVHIAAWEELSPLVREVPDSAGRLAEAFWPGPLTMVFKRSDRIPEPVSAGLDTVAVRLPAHPVARRIIEKAGVPLAAPSANRSGAPSPTTAAHVLQDMDGKIAAVVDGGVCDVGVESTVVALDGEKPILLRPGGITLEQLREVLGEVEIAPAVLEKMETGERAASPGMKYKHYAPRTQITIARGGREHFLSYANTLDPAEYAALCFEGEEAGLTLPCVTFGAEKDQKSQAQRLFEALRELDGLGREKAVARCPGLQGVGLAVYNRLLRASAFRVLSLQEGAENQRLMIGLTGPTGAGKSTVAYAFAGQGCGVIDADFVARQAVVPGTECLKELAAAFGAEILNPDGSLNRKRLAARAFASEEGRNTLNAITHPAVTALIRRQTEELFIGGYDIIVLDAPLLIESGAHALCDRIISVLAPRALRKERIMARDSLSEEAAERRLSAQPEDDFYIRNSDEILQNEESDSALYRSALQMIHRMKETFYETKKPPGR